MPPLFILSHSQSNGLRLASPLQALLYDAYPGCVLLNKAVGGSSILSWQQGSANYSAALNDVRRLLPDYTPACIISVIGETDARSKATTANGFKALFWDAMTDFRADIGYQYLPVIFVQLGPKPLPVDGKDLYPAWEEVQDGQAGLLAGHTAYRMVQGLGGYEPGKPYCHRTADVNILQAELVFDAIRERVKL